MRKAVAGRAFASSPWQTIATTNSADRWTTNRQPHCSLGRRSVIIRKTTSSTATGKTRIMRSMSLAVERLNTRMKLSKYSVSGRIHRSGTAAMSVVM